MTRMGARAGFTVVEMLVASVLVGMLLTVLTMVFNSTAIAWRTGTTCVAKLNDVREYVARTRLEADNLYIWRGAPHAIVSIWNHTSSAGAKRLRKRTVDFAGNPVTGPEQIGTLQAGISTFADVKKSGETSATFAMPAITTQVRDGNNYTVNVRSAGPNRTHNDFDDIWSYPDDFDY